MPFDNTNYETQIDRDLRILRAAREGISKPGGWCKRVATEGLAHCIIGWVDISGGLGCVETNRLANRVLVPALPLRYRQTGFNIVEFNDGYNRKQADVVALFDRAIARLEHERGA
jgi:hypothetical protein